MPKNNKLHQRATTTTLQRRLLNGENMQIGNKAPCGQNNAYFTLKIACLIVMIMNKKNLKARISKKGKYHIAHIQMPQWLKYLFQD